MESILNVAKYFLQKASMPHKKLQKLCYYAQAWNLANYGEPLVPNRFEAWVHGPVSPDLYFEYREWGWLDIPSPPPDAIHIQNKSVQQFLDLVYKVYGNYTADQLEQITHQEEPWIKARVGLSALDYSRNPISQTIMRDYYKKRMTPKNE